MNDLISRQAAIDALANFFIPYVICDESTESYTNGLTDAYYLILQLPSAQPEQRWIPVSERLPEDGELVLFSTKTDRVFEGIYFADDTGRQWYVFRDKAFAYNNVVTAWLPLPEPYKAESEDKE